MYKFTVMTSPSSLSIYCKSEEKARSVAKKILLMAKELEKKYNFYNETSYLSALNRREINKLDLQTKDILRRSKLFYNKTGGIFDITMGTLVKSRRLSTIEAIRVEVERLSPFVGVEHFMIKKDKLFFDNPYTLIDLGGFVKEFAVDQAVKILKKEKIESALINFGGDIYALGLKPDGEAFSVGIRNPLSTNDYIAHVSISNQALTTSGSYERNHEVEGRCYSHIISKDDLEERILSATVIASSVVESGVFSTSLMINPKISTSLKTILINKSLEVLTT